MKGVAKGTISGPLLLHLNSLPSTDGVLSGFLDEILPFCKLNLIYRA